MQLSIPTSEASKHERSATTAAAGARADVRCLLHWVSQTSQEFVGVTGVEVLRGLQEAARQVSP